MRLRRRRRRRVRAAGRAPARELSAFLVDRRGAPREPRPRARSHARRRCPSTCARRTTRSWTSCRRATRAASWTAPRCRTSARSRANGHAARGARAVTRTAAAERGGRRGVRRVAPAPGVAPSGLDDDFFLDLGGNSLVAAQVVSTPAPRPGAGLAHGARRLRGAHDRGASPRARCLWTPRAPVAPAPPGRRPASPAPRPGALAQLAWVAGALVPGSAALLRDRVRRRCPRSTGRWGACRCSCCCRRWRSPPSWRGCRSRCC